MRRLLAILLAACPWQGAALAQCAPAPDSAYFFRDLSEQRAAARIAGNRAFFERLLSETFTARESDGRQLSKVDFIATELGTNQTGKERRSYAISDYRFAEHRQGHTVVTYLLREGVAAGTVARVGEYRLRETYEVIDGQWRLTSVETIAEPGDAPSRAAR